jgi:hypothetical protein
MKKVKTKVDLKKHNDNAIKKRARNAFEKGFLTQ